MKSLLFLILLVESCFGALSEPVTAQKIETFVKEGSIGSIEEFLAAAPESLRTRYNLVYSSRSVQQSNYQNPRVIMYSKNAQTLMSFNGGGRILGGNTLEFILFDKKSAKFDLVEVEFGRGAPRIEKNPSRCLGCHGEDPRPIWSSEGFWKGVYGSNQNRLTSRFLNSDGSEDRTEYFQMSQFKAEHQKHSRYRYLVDLKNRYIEGEAGNSELTELVLNMNSKRIKRMLNAHPKYHEIKRPLLALTSCGYKDFMRTLPEGMKLDLRYKGLYSVKDYASPLRIGVVHKDHLYAFLRNYDIPASRFDTTFNFFFLKDRENPDLYDDLTVFSSPGRFDLEFAAEFAKGDPELERLILSRSTVMNELGRYRDRAVIDCEKL